MRTVETIFSHLNFTWNELSIWLIQPILHVHSPHPRVISFTVLQVTTKHKAVVGFPNFISHFVKAKHLIRVNILHYIQN